MTIMGVRLKSTGSNDKVEYRSTTGLAQMRYSIHVPLISLVE
jgi:hypothetical protein